MSSNNRDGSDNNIPNIIYKCEVCGSYHRRPAILDGGNPYCSLKCFEEYKEVSHALADMSITELLDTMKKALDVLTTEDEDEIARQKRIEDQSGEISEGDL